MLPQSAAVDGDLRERRNPAAAICRVREWLLVISENGERTRLSLAASRIKLTGGFKLLPRF